MWYGQFVIGPPGAGKTTYCYGMQQMCNALNRRHIVINLDPANDAFQYDCAVDVRKLVNVENVMEDLKLGPNGALIYCIEYLVKNLDWLENQLQQFVDSYLIFDCPGQVELYCHHEGMTTLLRKLQKMDARLTAVHLVDGTLCTDPQKYISALLVSLSGQIMLELPHVNVFTKIDLLKHVADDLSFRIEYYAEVQDLSKILLLMQGTHPLDRKFANFNALVCEIIEDFNLVGFRLLDIQNKESVLDVLKEVDAANGFSLGSLYSDLGIFNVAITARDDINDNFGTIQERYVDVDSVHSPFPTTISDEGQ